jgi:hypothetical protein
VFPFLFVLSLCVVAFYFVLYAITFIMLLLGKGDEVLEEQRMERVRLYNAFKVKK